MNKQIFRSNNNRLIGGVCGGLAEYFSISVDIVRILWVLLSIMYNIRVGLIAYIICMVLLPKAPVGYYQEQQYDFGYKNFNNIFDFNNKRNKFLIGSVFIVLGTILSLKKIFSIDDVLIYSIFFIFIGIYLIVRGGKE